jgi:protein associated with RNAse G/E
METQAIKFILYSIPRKVVTDSERKLLKVIWKD